MDALIAAVYELHTETVEYLIGAVSQCERSAEGGGKRRNVMQMQMQINCQCNVNVSVNQGANSLATTI